MATPTLISATPRINSITGDTVYTYTYSDGSVYTANASNPTAIFQTYAPGGVKNSLTNRVKVNALPDGNIPNPAGSDSNYVQTVEQKTATEQAAQQAAADLAAQQAAQQAAADLAAQQAAQQPVAPVAPVAPPAPTVVSSGSVRNNGVWGQQVQLSDGSVTFYPGSTLPFAAGTSATTLPTNGTVITSAEQAAATQAQQLADQQAFTQQQAEQAAALKAASTTVDPSQYQVNPLTGETVQTVNSQAPGYITAQQFTADTEQYQRQQQLQTAQAAFKLPDTNTITAKQTITDPSGNQYVGIPANATTGQAAQWYKVSGAQDINGVTQQTYTPVDSSGSPTVQPTAPVSPVAPTGADLTAQFNNSLNEFRAQFGSGTGIQSVGLNGPANYYQSANGQWFTQNPTGGFSAISDPTQVSLLNQELQVSAGTSAAGVPTAPVAPVAPTTAGTISQTELNRLLNPEAETIAAQNTAAASAEKLQQEAAQRVTDVNAQIDAQQKAQAEQDAAMAAQVAQAEKEALQLKFKNIAFQLEKNPAYGSSVGLNDYKIRFLGTGESIGPTVMESFDPATQVTKTSLPVYDVANQVTWYPTSSGWQQQGNSSLSGYNTNITMQLPEVSDTAAPFVGPGGVLYYPQTNTSGVATGWFQGEDPTAPGYVAHPAEQYPLDQTGLPVNAPTTGPYSSNYKAPGVWDWYDPVAAGAFTSQAAIDRYMQNKANETFSFSDVGGLLANFDKTINQTVGWDGLAAMAIGGWLGPVAGALTSVAGGLATGKDPKTVITQAAITYAVSYGLGALNDSLASAAQSATESAVSNGTITPEEGANIAEDYINNAVDIGDAAAADAGYNNASDYYDAVDNGYTDSSNYYTDYPAGTSGPEIPGATEVTPTGSVTNPDGSITTTYDNGSSITINTDGTVTTGGTVPTSTTPVSPDTTWSDIQGQEYAGPANPDYIKTGTGTVTVEPTADYYNAQGIPQIEVTGGGYETTAPVNVDVSATRSGDLLDAISNLTPAQIAAAGGVAALLAGGAAAIAAAGGGGGAAAGAVGSTAATTGTTSTGAVAPTGGATAAPVEPTAPTTGGATGGTTTPPPTEPTTGPVSPEATGGAATGTAGGTATTGGTTGATTGTTTGEVAGTTGTTGGTGGTTTGGATGTGTTTGPVSPEGTTGTTTGTTTTGGVQPEQPPAPVSSTTTGAPGETVTNPAGETTTTPLPPAEQPPAPVTESGPPQTIKTVADAQAAGISAETIAKWLASGLIVSALSTTVPVQPNWSSFYAGQAPWHWGTAAPVGTTGGINPGLLMGQTAPHYQNAGPGQNQYYWGQHPTVTSTQNIGQQWNNVPYAPVTPYGLATSAVGGTQHLDVPQFIQQTIGTPQYQAAAQGSAQYMPIAPSTAVVGGQV